MSKRSVFTTISPLPAGVSREAVTDFLHSHVDMIDLNPLVIERHPINAPAYAAADEQKCAWYSLTDKIDYLPGGLAAGDISYTCAFLDLPTGIQTRCRAPLGVDIREKWTVNGTLPGEAPQPTELGLGAPASGLYLREDVELRCNIIMSAFVKKNLKRAHATLVDRLVAKATAAAAVAATTKRASAASAAGNNTQQHQHQQHQQPTPPWSPATVHPAFSPPAYASTYSSEAGAGAPPQLGSPFIPGYTPGEASSIGYTSTSSSPETDQAATTSSTSPPAPRAPAPAPVKRTIPTARYTLVPRVAPTPDPALLPPPLRIRHHHQQQHQQQRQHDHHHHHNKHSRSSSSPSSSSSSRSSTLCGGDNNNDNSTFYPEMNPYQSHSADDDSPSSPDEPRTPPPFLAELEGETIMTVVGEGRPPPVPPKTVVIALDQAAWQREHHPAALRPGGARMMMSARLSGPFIAELE